MNIKLHIHMITTKEELGSTGEQKFFNKNQPHPL